MYLSTIEVKNFRSLKDLRADFQPGFNVLVGRNNTGKTNLLYAIRHALGPGASHGDALWLDKDDFYKESAEDATERTIQITLTFADLSEAQRSHFYEIVDFDLADISKSKAVVRYEASWPKGKRQATIKRTGGAAAIDPPEVPTRILESLPITFLPALRNAEASLAPGYRSRLALLLEDLAVRNGNTAKGEIEDIFKKANGDLEGHLLISKTRDSLRSTTKALAGTDYSASAIKASGLPFDKILRNLQVQMDGAPIGELDANGLGYNNLLYMAVVLEHLKDPYPTENPLFLIEEPEAHLHPQLTMLLADYLANKTPGSSSTPQTIVTTHSPTLAANVPPSRVTVLFSEPNTRQIQCNAIAKAGMDAKEDSQLQRMMDVTRATLYFAKAAILVEGISEALLVPVLAKRLGYNLAEQHISVIPICGVAFETFEKLLCPEVLGIPTAIITDADPPVPTSGNWIDAMPAIEDGTFKVCARTKKLISLFDGHQTVKVFNSKLTLEYDLAEAGAENALVMAAAWESCFVGTAGTFNKQKVLDAGTDTTNKALVTWRGICRAEHTGSKAELAHRLAAELERKTDDNDFATPFEVPDYLKNAIVYVVESVQSSTPTPSPVPEIPNS